MKLKYAAVFEKAPNNWAAYVPDVPGCISVGDTWDEMLAMIDEALRFHIDSMLEDGDPLPEPERSINEAIVHHIEVLDKGVAGAFPEYDFPPTIATRFEFVEIEVEVPEAARTGSEADRKVLETAAAG